MPQNTRKIDRSTKWGNQFKIGQIANHPLTNESVFVADAEIAVALFSSYLETRDGTQLVDAAHNELCGKDLACWCKEGNACHGDVLLRVANRTARRRAA
jgi:hypothetical protein